MRNPKHALPRLLGMAALMAVSCVATDAFGDIFIEEVGGGLDEAVEEAIFEEVAARQATEFALLEEEEVPITATSTLTSQTSTPVPRSVEPVATDVDSGITGIDFDLFEGEFRVKIYPAVPVTDSRDQVIRISLLFLADEGDQIVASLTLLEGSDLRVSSFCIGETASCRDGIFPVGADVCYPMNEISFTMPADAFANSSGITVGVSVQTAATEADLPQVDLRRFGEQFPLPTD